MLLIILAIMAGILTCKNEGNDVSDNCICESNEEPDSAYLTIKVTPNIENPYVHLTIYQHRYDPKDTTSYLKDSSNTGIYRHYVPVNNYYSVRAKYKSVNKIIYAFDGGILEAQEESGCANTCWQIVGGNLDATLVFR